MSRYILLLEDNPSDQMILSALIKNEGCEPIVASNGHDGLELFDEYNFSLLIVDLQMPFMGGIEFMQRARQQGIEVPVIVSSAKKEASAVKKAIESGASDYIVKPTDPMIFKEKVKKFLSTQEKWADYEPIENSEYNSSFVCKETKLKSISEIGVCLMSNIPAEEGELTSVGGQFLVGSGFSSVQAKVKSCKKTPAQEEYEIKLEFVGADENVRKQIRKACKAIWDEKVKKDKD